MRTRILRKWKSEPPKPSYTIGYKEAEKAYAFFRREKELHYCMDVVPYPSSFPCFICRLNSDYTVTEIYEWNKEKNEWQSTEKKEEQQK